MKYKKIKNTIALRLNVGEEITSSLTELCEKENIRFAQVNGIGATKKVTVGTFNTDTKQYHSKTFNEIMELVSLLGNLTVKDGKPYVHLHACLADENGQTFGGHLNEAVIGVTAEIFVNISDCETGRIMQEETGINIWDI